MTKKHLVLWGLPVFAALLLWALPMGAQGKLVVIQTNASGLGAHVIDVATNEVLGEITDIERPHGAALAPDGSRIYITNEAMSTLDVVDAKTFKVTKRIPLSGHPNNLGIGKDGKKVYVGIAEAPGGVDVIDTVAMKRIKTIPTKGRIHNTYVTHDGKYAYAGSIPGKSLNVIDTATDTMAWQLDLDLGVRPMTDTWHPDGSTQFIVTQLTEFNGFAVIDFKTRKEVKRIKNPALPPGRKEVPEGSDPSHGLAVTADGKTLAVCSRLNNALYTYSIPDFELTGTTFLSGMGSAWVTTADNKAYVAEPVTDTMAVVDLKTMKQIASVPVGFVPKRNIAGILAQ